MKPIPRIERRVLTLLTRVLWFRSRRRTPGPVPDWLPHEPRTIIAPDGARLSARWFPAKDAQATVVFAHPDRRYAQDWFILAGWIDLVHELGLNALTFDFVGYGESRGGQNYHHEHLLAAIRHARQEDPGLPLHVVGVSLGAFVAANASREADIDILVLESPYPTLRSWYGRGMLATILRGVEATFPRSSHRIDATQSLRRSRARRILVVASEDDSVTPIHLSEEVARAGPPERTRMLRLQGPQHLDLFVESEEYAGAVRAILTPTGANPRPGAAPVAHGSHEAQRREHPRHGLAPRRAG